jgi:gluconolactonase
MNIRLSALLALVAALAFVPGLLAAAPNPAPAAAASPIAPGAKLEKISGEFGFTEGASCDATGNVYFTDQPNNRIMKYSTDGKLTEFLKPVGRANGTKIDAAGNIIACADEKNELWSIDIATKKATVLVKDYQGKLLNGPNDVWIRPDGGMYLSDPFTKRGYWTRGAQEIPNSILFLSPDRKTLTRVTEDVTNPNGVIGTPDGKTLYVGDFGSSKTYAYDIQNDGTLKNKRLFCNMPSDGMTLDERGNVYLTGRGVTIFDKAGTQIATIPVPDESWTGNLCFGGADRQTLFICASKGFYSIKMSVKGTVFPKPAEK